MPRSELLKAIEDLDLVDDLEAIERALGTFFRLSRNSRFQEAVHHRSGFAVDRATLPRADFTEASMHEASLEGARCAEAVFDRARLTNLRAGGRADLTGVRARHTFARDARLQDSVLDQADLSFSNLEGADFSQSNMVQTTLNQCVLRRASFRGAVMVGAVILKSDAMEACFEAARLSHADLRGTSCFGAAFWEAVTDDARWELADLRRTLLDPEASR